MPAPAVDGELGDAPPALAARVEDRAHHLELGVEQRQVGRVLDGGGEGRVVDAQPGGDDVAGGIHACHRRELDTGVVGQELRGAPLVAVVVRPADLGGLQHRVAAVLVLPQQERAAARLQESGRGTREEVRDQLRLAHRHGHPRAPDAGQLHLPEVAVGAELTVVARHQDDPASARLVRRAVAGQAGDAARGGPGAGGVEAGLGPELHEEVEGERDPGLEVHLQGARERLWHAQRGAASAADPAARRQAVVDDVDVEGGPELQIEGAGALAEGQVAELALGEVRRQVEGRRQLPGQGGVVVGPPHRAADHRQLGQRRELRDRLDDALLPAQHALE